MIKTIALAWTLVIHGYSTYNSNTSMVSVAGIETYEQCYDAGVKAKEIFENGKKIPQRIDWVCIETQDLTITIPEGKIPS